MKPNFNFIIIYDNKSENVAFIPNTCYNAMKVHTLIDRYTVNNVLEKFVKLLSIKYYV